MSVRRRSRWISFSSRQWHKSSLGAAPRRPAWLYFFHKWAFRGAPGSAVIARLDWWWVGYRRPMLSSRAAPDWLHYLEQAQSRKSEVLGFQAFSSKRRTEGSFTEYWAHDLFRTEFLLQIVPCYGVHSQGWAYALAKMAVFCGWGGWPQELRRNGRKPYRQQWFQTSTQWKLEAF